MVLWEIVFEYLLDEIFGKDWVIIGNVEIVVDYCVFVVVGCGCDVIDYVVWEGYIGGDLIGQFGIG